MERLKSSIIKKLKRLNQSDKFILKSKRIRIKKFTKLLYKMVEVNLKILTLVMSLLMKFLSWHKRFN